MKQYKYLLLLILGVFLVGCNKTNLKGDATNETISENVVTTGPITKNKDADKDLLKFENQDGVDFTELKYLPSEMTKDKKLEDAFAKVYDFKVGEDNIRYYYNRIDLNGDGNPETFVYLLGSSVGGSGGSSALIFESNGEEYKLLSRFTLVRNPVIISDSKTNGWNDIVMQVSGGGIEGFFAELKYDNSTYPLNPSMQPKVKEGTIIKGTAIIADDITKNKGIEFK